MNGEKGKKTAKRAGVFIIVGLILTIINYALYTFFARVIIQNNDLLWLSSFISTFIVIFVAYAMHSKITWKERCPTKASIIRFFIWNVALAVAIAPFLTWIFGMMDFLYDFGFMISGNIGLPFDREFIESTGAFCLATAVTMILNFFFYDRFVFGEEKKKEVERNESEMKEENNES